MYGPEIIIDDEAFDFDSSTDVGEEAYAEMQDEYFSDMADSEDL